MLKKGVTAQNAVINISFLKKKRKKKRWEYSFKNFFYPTEPQIYNISIDTDTDIDVCFGV